MARKYKSTITYKLREIPVKSIKVWKEAQARKLDREGIAELAKSIKADGLQNPPMVQKEGKEYLLMSGQRRLAALKRLGAKKVPVLVLINRSKYDLDTAKAASVVENVHRNKMNTKEIADACKFLAEQMGKSKAAKMLGYSQLTFRKYLGFAAVPGPLKELVPQVLSRDEMTKLYQAVPNVKKATKIADKISRLAGPLRKSYLKVLSRRPNASHKKLLTLAKASGLQKRVGIKLNKTQAKRLQNLAKKKDQTPDEVLADVVKKYLKKR